MLPGRFGPSRVLAAMLFVACFARSSAAGPQALLPPPTHDPKLIASLARLTTTRDSVQFLLDGHFFLDADSLASRHLTQIEATNGADSREVLEALLIVAEARALRGRTLGRNGSKLLDRIRTLERDFPFSPREEARFEALQGKALHVADRYDSAAAHLDRALAILASTSGTESPEYARELPARALTLRARGRLAEATPLLEQACRIDERELGVNSPQYLDALEYLISSPQYASDPGSQIETYDRIYAGFRRCFGDRAPRLWLVAYHASGAYEAVGRRREARNLILEALAITEANRLRDFDGMLEGVLAGIEMDLGNYVAAESIYADEIVELRAAKSPDDGIPMFFPRQNRAMALDALGRYEEAESELRSLEPGILRAWGEDSDYMASNAYLRGRAALARGDTAFSRAMLERAQAAARLALPKNNPDTREYEASEIESRLALCHWLAGRRRDAFELALRVETDSRNRLRHVTRSLSDDDALAVEGIREGGLGLALTALLSEGAQTGDTARVFDAVVRSRALVLDAVTARHVRARRSPSPVVQAVVDSLESLGRDVASFAVAEPPVLRDRAERERELRTRRRVLTARLAALDPARASEYGGEAVGADEVISALPARGVLVSFVRFDRYDSPAGSAVDRRKTTPWYAGFVAFPGTVGVRAIDLGPANAIDDRIDRWRALMLAAGAHSGAAEALGDTLRRQLWDRIVVRADESTKVFVVPDGHISLLSFAALPTSDDQFVLEACGPIAYLSAERDLASALPRAAGQGWIVLGDPDYSRATMATAETVGEPRSTSDATADLQASYADVYRGHTSHCEDFRELAFSRLLQSGAEARDIAELSRRSEVPVALLTGAEASEQSFKRYAPGRSLIHVASHGFFFSSRCSREPADEESPLIRSGIALAGANERAQMSNRADEDGILTAEEVATLNLTAARCVFLSACESGVGDVSTGEGVIGLRRAFHEAGAGALVSTLWEVEDSATRGWVREFYRAYLDSSSDPAWAARQASLALVRRQRSAGNPAMPATWGAFLVSGR